jgi:hypothetical protein
LHLPEDGEIAERIEHKMEAMKDTLEYLNTDLMVQKESNAYEFEAVKRELTITVDEQMLFLKQQLADQSKTMTVLFGTIESMKRAPQSRQDPVISNSKLKVLSVNQDGPAEAATARSLEEMRCDVAELSRRQDLVEKQVPAANVNELMKRLTVARENLSAVEKAVTNLPQLVTQFEALYGASTQLAKRVDSYERQMCGFDKALPEGKAFAKRLGDVEAMVSKLGPIVSDICDPDIHKKVGEAGVADNQAWMKKVTSDDRWATPNSQHASAGQDFAVVKNANMETRHNVSLLAEALGMMDTRLAALEKSSRAGGMSPRLAGRQRTGESVVVPTHTGTSTPGTHTPMRYMSQSDLDIPLRQEADVLLQSGQSFNKSPPRGGFRNASSSPSHFSLRKSLLPATDRRSPTPPRPLQVVPLGSPSGSVRRQPMVPRVSMPKVDLMRTSDLVRMSAEVPAHTPRMSPKMSPKMHSAEVAGHAYRGRYSTGRNPTIGSVSVPMVSHATPISPRLSARDVQPQEKARGVRPAQPSQSSNIVSAQSGPPVSRMTSPRFSGSSGHRM